MSTILNYYFININFILGFKGLISKKYHFSKYFLTIFILISLTNYKLINSSSIKWNPFERNNVLNKYIRGYDIMTYKNNYLYKWRLRNTKWTIYVTCSYYTHVKCDFFRLQMTRREIFSRSNVKKWKPYAKEIFKFT